MVSALGGGLGERRPRTMSRNQRKRGTAARRSPKRNHARTATRPASSTVADLQERVSALTRELAEAREQQTATSEVLGIISKSPGELEPVFEAMLANAVRLCDAKFGTLNLYDGEAYRNVACTTSRQPFPSAQLFQYRRRVMRDLSWSRQSAAQHGSNEAGATRRRPLRRAPAYSRTPVGGGDVAT